MSEDDEWADDLFNSTFYSDEDNPLSEFDLDDIRLTNFFQSLSNSNTIFQLSKNESSPQDASTVTDNFSVEQKRILGSNRSSVCSFNSIEKFNNYLNRIVSDNHFKKLAKEFKIAIFNKITSYVQQKYPEIYNEDFKRLSRDDKRSVELLDKRLFAIRDIIFQLFESDEKMSIIIPIKKEICKIISKKNKKKNVRFSQEELTFIDKWEVNQTK